MHQFHFHLTAEPNANTDIRKWTISDTDLLANMLPIIELFERASDYII